MSSIIGAFFHALRFALLAVGALGLASLVFAYSTGLYPIAIVDGSPVWKSTWDQMIEASKNFTNADRRANGHDTYDFSLPTHEGLLRDIEKETLTFLIEDKIALQEGSVVIDGFGSATGEEIQKIIRDSRQEPAIIAKEVYGLDEEEYRTYILAPQVRRDLLAKRLKNSKRTLEEWFYEMKIRKSVKLYFTSYTWSGQEVE